jgi:hypothetical protein
MDDVISRDAVDGVQQLRILCAHRRGSVQATMSCRVQISHYVLKPLSQSEGI